MRMIILMASLFMLGCKSDSPKAFVKDIPIDKNGKSALFNSIILIRDSLKIDTLENGYSSTQIRIWLNYSFTSKSQLIILDGKDGWRAEYIEIEPKYLNDTGGLSNITGKRFVKRPINSWEHLLRKIYRYNILTLPDAGLISGYTTPYDPNGVTVEVGTADKYRFYHYSAPSIAASKHKEAADMEQILDVITQEFNIKLLSRI